MRRLIFGLLIAMTSSQNPTTIDPDVYGFFNLSTTAVPVTIPTTQRLVENTVKSGNLPTQLDKDGQPCQCVPYYLCDKTTHIAVDINNKTVTGYEQIDFRFGENEFPPCASTNEICCIIPPDGSKPTPKPKPQPNPSKLKGCGYRNPEGTGAFFKGAPTQFGEYPWVVALLDAYNGSYVGVGVLIHPEVVMTIAHVTHKYGPGSLKIRAGEWDTQTIMEIFDFQERIVKDMYFHQDFNPRNLQNDIVLFRLESPLELVEHINVICMPEKDEVFDSHKNCVSNGWGKDIFGAKGHYAVVLKKVEVDMVPHSRCNLLLKKTRLGSNFMLHDSFLCAGGDEGKDTCEGDGGAPLACPMGNNRYKLTGLVSWGIGCGQKDVPAVFTNVPMYRDWVDNKMAEWGLPMP